MLIKTIRAQGLAACSLALFLLTYAALSTAKLEAQQIEQSVENLASQILGSLQAEGKTKVAIVELTDLAGNVTPLGRLLAEELTSQLFSTAEASRLKLVERSKLDEVLGEQRLGIQGLLEKRNVETFGRVFGVEAILTGTTALLTDRIRINVRLIGVPSAELFATAAAYMSRLGISEDYTKPEEVDGTSGGGSAGSGPIATRDFKGIRYELLNCKQDIRLIVCDFILTNNGADCEFRLDLTWGSKTYLYDQRGFQFFATRVLLADIEVAGNGIRKRLITEIPVEAKVFFEGVPSAIEFIKILHVSTGDGALEFRDVRLSD